MQIDIANKDAAGRNYLTWAPQRATLRHPGVAGANPITATVRNSDPSKGGQLEFSARAQGPFTSTLTLALPASGAAVEFFVAGALGKPSTADGDAVITVTAAGNAAPALSKPVMVRIRKDANTLTPAERSRFTTALAKLNNAGTGLFKDFREMHRQQIALNQAHGSPGFLSWHRAYLLDLERELQKIDASVALPYWRFDKAAPNVFAPDFLGRTAPGSSTVVFAPNNLLQGWRTDGGPGISRQPGRPNQPLDPTTRGAFVSNQATTLLIGGAKPNAVFDTGPGTGGFDEMEGDPHGSAHTSFTGWIRSPGTAPRDPLFFLLHCNVDRLWALWQWFNNRFKGTDANTYFFRGSASSAGAVLIGHNLLDTMWPWNNVTGGLRPLNAPRTPFPVVPTAPAPGAAPTVGDMIDYQGLVNPASFMGFAYDDVPYGVAS